jgi:hypothetical protein
MCAKMNQLLMLGPAVRAHAIRGRRLTAVIKLCGDPPGTGGTSRHIHPRPGVREQHLHRRTLLGVHLLLWTACIVVRGNASREFEKVIARSLHHPVILLSE